MRLYEYRRSFIDGKVPIQRWRWKPLLMNGTKLHERPSQWETFFVTHWTERKLGVSNFHTRRYVRLLGHRRPSCTRLARRRIWCLQRNDEDWSNGADEPARPVWSPAQSRTSRDKASIRNHGTSEQLVSDVEPNKTPAGQEAVEEPRPLDGPARKALEKRFPQLSRASVTFLGYLAVLCVRIFAATTLIAITAGVWIGYMTMNRHVRLLASEIGHAQLGRTIRVGRLKRLVLPLGVALGQVEITSEGTKPSGVVGDIQLRLAIEPQRWLTRRPGRLRMDARVGNALLRVHQQGPADWDLGLSSAPMAKASSVSAAAGTGPVPAGARDTSPSSRKSAGQPEKAAPKHATSEQEPSSNGEAALVTIRSLHVDRSRLMLHTVGAGDFAYGRGAYTIRHVHGRLRFSEGMETLAGAMHFQTERRGIGSCELNADFRSGVNQVTIQVTAVPANLVGALINLPFESDAGKVQGTVSLTLRPEARTPEMSGAGRLHGVALRLAPDAPTFTDVSGRLRFDDSMVIFEGPTGFFGQLPITVVGTVDISKDYNLIGFVRRVAIKDILQTFRMDPSLPLHGSVKAEVRMHGPLESPLLTGTATSVGPPWRADRIPIQNARADFQLDASSMQLEIMNMEATLQDGGQLSGQGSLRLASTKERTTSSEPKPPISGGAAASESGAVSPSLGAPPSIDFSLNLRRAYAGPLLAHYLPKTTPPETCVDPIGRITANLILSGPLTETKLELRWRLIGTNPLSARSAAETVSLETVKPNAKLYGAACGTLQMSLADVAETQRLRFTLDAYGVDLRRFLWRPAWSSAPKVLLDTRLFADVTLQTLTKTEAAPRNASARAQTNGAQRPLQLQATLDLRRFQLNAFGYTRRMSGELRYHPVDGLRFDAVPYDQRTERSTDERSEPDHRSRSKFKPSYLASFSSDPSFKRELEVHLRHGAFRLEASLHQGTRFEAHMENMPIERLLGHDYGAGGIVQARASIDLEQERGTSSFALRDAYFRHFRCREFTGEMYWLDKTVFLQNSVLQQERSEYHIEGVYSDNKPRLDDSPQTLPNWQTKIVIPRGDIAELACLTQAFDGQLDPTVLSFWEIPPHLSLEDQILWFAEYWSASADEDPQMAIGRAHQRHSASSAAGERDTSASSSTSRAVSVTTRNARMGSKNTEQPPSLADLRGTYRGTITLSSGVERLSFDLSGEKWALGPHELGTMRARGGMRQGIINLEQLSFQAPTTGTMVHLNGTAEPAGSVKASVQVAKIPLHLLSEYGWAPFRITGALNASVELAGTVQEPMLRLKALWQDASLNGLRMRDTLAELVCEAGRCRVSATAAVPVQQRNWGPVRPRWRFWKRSTANTAQQRWLDHEEDPETAKQARSGTSGTRASASTALGSSMPLSGIRLNGSVPFRLSSILERFMDMNRPWNERLEGWSFAQVFRGGHPSDSMHLDVQVKRSGVALATAFFPQLPVSGGSADLRIRLRGTPLHPQVTARCSLSDVRISPPDLETPIESVYGEAELRDWALHVHSMTGLIQGRVWSLKGMLPVWSSSSSTWYADQSDVESAREHEPLTLHFESLPIHLRDRYHGFATGQVLVHGSAVQPVVRGSLTLHDGSMMLLPGPSNRSDQRPAASTLRPENELDMRTYESDEQFVNPFLELVEQGFPDVTFEQFQLRLGSRTRVVFPLVLSLHLQGDVELNGPLSDLRPNGSFRIHDGSLNLLTTRFYLNRSVTNTVSFSPDAELGAPLDPILHVSLSDRRKYTVRLRNLRASKWENGLEVLDAQGTPLERSQLVAMLNERLGNVSANLQLRRGGSLALRSFLNAYSVGGSLGRGGTLWRLSPNLTAAGDGSSLVDAGLFSEQLGVYGELESGRFVLSFSRDMQGLGITSISYRPWERIKMEYEKRETGEQHLEAKIYFRGASDD